MTRRGRRSPGGAGVEVRVAGFAAVAAQGPVPGVDRDADLAGEPVEGVRGGAVEVAGLGLAWLDEANVGPREGAFGVVSGLGGEVEGGGAGGVVDVGDDTDVVPIGGADVLADGDVSSDIDEPLEPLFEFARVRPCSILVRCSA